MSRKEYMYWQTRKYRVSEVHLCASERSERAIFGVFNSFTVKKVSFFTINVKSYLQKVWGGCLYRPSPHPKKVGGYIPPSPPPPGIYASVCGTQKYDMTPFFPKLRGTKPFYKNELWIEYTQLHALARYHKFETISDKVISV